MPDLLGLRVTGRHLIGKVRRKLPGVSRELLLERLAPADLARPFDNFDGLVDAAAAAVALPDLAGADAERVAAKNAAVSLASPHLTSRE